MRQYHRCELKTEQKDDEMNSFRCNFIVDKCAFDDNIEVRWH